MKWTLNGYSSIFAFLSYDIRYSKGCTFLLERKVPKEIAFLQADEAVLFIGGCTVKTQQPIPCYPALRDQAYPFGIVVQITTDDGSKKAIHSSPWHIFIL